MPSKKKKYNARFPPARIKKIMQTDEEVGKVAAAVPVMISRALELFVESLVKKASDITKSRNAKTLTTSHLKACVLADDNFHFLTDLVATVPDVQADDDSSAACYEGHMPPANSHRQNSGRGRRVKAKAKPGEESAGPSHSTADESETWSGEDDDDEDSESSSETASDNHMVSSLASSSIPPPSYNASFIPGGLHSHVSHQVKFSSTTSSADEDYDL